MKPVVGQTTFGASTSGTTTQLDNNFLLAYTALNDFNTYPNFLTDTGSANSIVVNLGANLTGVLTNGLVIQVKIAATNTGATNLNYNSGGNLNVLNLDGSALAPGQLTIGSIVQLAYRASDTTWQLMTSAARPITMGTPQASTSGTSIDFSSIPSGVKRIAINFAGVSTNGTSIVMIQIGDSGGIETSGYLGSAYRFGGAGVSFTAGFQTSDLGDAASIRHGSINLYLQSAASFTWAFVSSIGSSEAANLSIGAGSKALSAELDRVRITTVNGTDAFDAGSINIQYE